MGNIDGHYDVIVCGGGPGGIAAALGSAATGARTLLIERYGFLGGGATAMLVNPFMTYKAGSQQIIFGVFDQIITALRNIGAYGSPYYASAFDPEAYKLVTEKLCVDAGITLLYHAYLVNAPVNNSRITDIQLATKAGMLNLAADIFIDTTGDGDLAQLTGCITEKGRAEDGLCQPMTLNFRLAGVDITRMPSAREITTSYLAAKQRGEVDCPREDILFFHTTQPGVVHFNTTRIVMKDATDPWQLTEAEVEGRRQAWQITAFMKKEIAGFENAYLQMTAPQIGVRESRRIIGDYVMTADDCLQARKFPDAIARGSYCVDIHNPAGTGTIIQLIPKGDWYEIPYRCLLPKGPENLLIGSRCVSATHEAHSAIRVIPIVTAIGQAAGVAAGLSIHHACVPRSITARQVQEELLAQGQRFDKPGLDLPPVA